ncbi:branched-chain amino acid transaminase [Candidatus Marsarchaeota archaeon]|nr:branched-chain amino acid transaminase [Candidatus Marsarchaeota archaeon]
MDGSKYVWLDGKIIKSEEANVPILTHSLQYGSGIFEGIRAYKTDRGGAIFRLEDHVRRFFNSARIYSINLGISQAEFKNAIIETVKKNGLDECYIRPFAFYNDQSIGLGVSGKKVSVAVMAIPFGHYFANKENGIRCRVSSFHRINSLILPPQAKASGNYINSILASMEAKRSGADEAILLSSNGYVAEGPGENIFIVKDNALITPSASSDILIGITRDSVIRIAANEGIDVEEREVHREELLTCDEAFFTGTAAEITPIISVDSEKLGEGKVGKITSKIGRLYSDITLGKKSKYANWLTYL